MFIFWVVTNCNLLFSQEKKGKLCQKMTIRIKKNPRQKVRINQNSTGELRGFSFVLKTPFWFVKTIYKTASDQDSI